MNHNVFSKLGKNNSVNHFRKTGRGMIMITDSMFFFCTYPLKDLLRIYKKKIKKNKKKFLYCVFFILNVMLNFLHLILLLWWRPIIWSLVVAKLWVFFICSIFYNILGNVQWSIITNMCGLIFFSPWFCRTISFTQTVQ